MAIGFVRTDKGLRYFENNGLMRTQPIVRNNARISILPTGVIDKAEVSVGYLSQRDARWALVPVGKYYFGGSGCVPTVITMIVNALLGLDLIPTQVGSLLHERGYFNNGDIAGTVAEGVLFAASHYGLNYIGGLTLQKAADLLLAGGMISAAMNPGLFCMPGMTHEIIVFGYDHGRVNVLDPYWPEHNGVYDLSVIYAQKSTEPYDIANGGPLFGWTL